MGSIFLANAKPLRHACIAITLAVSSQGAALNAQTSGQSSQEIALPETEERRSDPINIRVAENMSAASECPFDKSDVRVTITDTAFVGAGGQVVVEPIIAALSGVNAPGDERPLSIVCDLRDQANAALRQGGWIASVAIPPQEIEGTLKLAVTTGRLANITIEGDPGPYGDYLDRLVGRLKQIAPLNERAVERELLNAIDVPGLRAGLTLSPSDAGPGQVDGTLAASFDRYSAFFNARNVNARTVGRETVFGRFELNGITGLADVTFVGAQTTVDFEEQFVLQAGHEFGIGPDNIRVGAQYVYAESSPNLVGLGIETETQVMEVYASYPAVRTPLSALDISVGLEIADQSTNLGAFRLTEDATRGLYLRAELDGQKRRLDRSTSLLYSTSLELRQGISAFGASDIGGLGFTETDGRIASRPFGEATATIVRGRGEVTWLPDEVFSLRAVVEGQWTNDPLLSFDEYAVGNLSIGRGYDPGANSGDRAIGAQLEVGANVWSSLNNRLQAFGFYDLVAIENLDPGTVDPTHTLNSVGGGLRLSLGRGVRAEVTYAVPLDPAIVGGLDEPPSRLMFSITTQLPALFR